MEKKKFIMKQFWGVEGTENPNNHLLSRDNSMEMINNRFQQVSVNIISDERNPTSDNHILCDILSRLPVKSLMRFKSVSKPWKSLIEIDSYLHDLHYKRSKSGLCGQRLVLFISLTEPDFNNPHKKPNNHAIKFSTCLPGSGQFDVKKLVPDRSSYGTPKQAVNGLVCINPSTGERSPWILTTTVSEGNAGDGKRQVWCIGFGFSPKTNENKVICISGRNIPKKKGETNYDYSYKDEEIAKLDFFLKWINYANYGDSIKWTEAELLLPFMWNAKPDFSIVAIPGTNWIILKPQGECDPDEFYYYDRSTKKSAFSGIPPDYHFGLRQITSLDESLAPVVNPTLAITCVVHLHSPYLE